MKRWFLTIRRGPPFTHVRGKLRMAQLAKKQAMALRFNRRAIGQERRELRKWLGEDYPWHCRNKRRRKVCLFQKRPNLARQRDQERELPF